MLICVLSDTAARTHTGSSSASHAAHSFGRLFMLPSIASKQPRPPLGTAIDSISVRSDDAGGWIRLTTFSASLTAGIAHSLLTGEYLGSEDTTA